MCVGDITRAGSFQKGSALIVFNLGCDADHRFEGWFGSGEDFARQQERGLVTCPSCGSAKIEKLLSAPRLNLSGARDQAAPAMTADQPVAMIDPREQQLRHLVRQVIENTEDVGPRFAEEARKIHYNEAAQRSIRGVATGEEARALVDEGIEVAQLPFRVTEKNQLN